MVIYVSLLVSIVGLLTYALTGNPKLAECGKIAYGVGLLAFLLLLPGAGISVAQGSG